MEGKWATIATPPVFFVPRITVSVVAWIIVWIINVADVSGGGCGCDVDDGVCTHGAVDWIQWR